MTIDVTGDRHRRGGITNFLKLIKLMQPPRIFLVSYK